MYPVASFAHAADSIMEDCRQAKAGWCFGYPQLTLSHPRCHDEAVRVLNKLGKEPARSPDWSRLHGQVAERLSPDWRPPFSPNGLVLLQMRAMMNIDWLEGSYVYSFNFEIGQGTRINLKIGDWGIHVLGSSLFANKKSRVYVLSRDAELFELNLKDQTASKALITGPA
jgi:hypothetical protein